MARPKSSDAFRLCGVNFEISVGLFLRKESVGVDKIRLADLLKIHLGVELDPQDGKSSRERETASFCSRFNTDPPRQEADLSIKMKTFCRNVF